MSNTGSPKVRETMQAIFVIKSGVMGLVLGACLMLPCLVPLVLWSIKTIIEDIIEKKTAAHVMML
jgi:hypothetical protein